MTDSAAANLLGQILGSGEATRSTHPFDREALSGGQKAVGAATCLAAFAVASVVFGVLGLPAIPQVSSLLLQGQPVYAILAAGFVLVLLTLLARPVVGGIRYDAPLFCAAVGLLALPVRGGDARNALLDSGSAAVYIKMAVELALLSVAVAFGYVALVRRTRPEPIEPDTELPAAEPADTAVDRATTVAVQTVFVLALLSLLGQTPLKGQALLGVAAAGGLGSWMTYKLRSVRGSVWPVAGTLLAGVVAYGWTYFHPDGVRLGDSSGLLAGAARSLPLHYATAGVAGTIYGYWAGRSGEAE